MKYTTAAAAVFLLLAISAGVSAHNTRGGARVGVHVDEVPQIGNPLEGAQAARALVTRPVTPALWCIMFLTFQSILLYTTLSISRNIDELNGEMTPSKATDVLAATTRTAVLAPMLCLVFVAVRNYVLDTTGGREEPPVWIQSFMQVCTYATFVQILVVVLLRWFTSDKDNKRFSERAGSANDAHPLVDSHHYEAQWSRWAIWALQIVSLVGVYGSVVMVIVGGMTYPEQQVKMSEPVKNTIYLGIIYFSVCLLMWIARTATEAVGDEGTGPLSAFRRATSAMSHVIKRIPMHAVIFLVMRFRTNQVDTIPAYAVACLYIITFATILEVLAAAYVGATGEEEIGYYGMEFFHSATWAHCVQHTFGFIAYSGLIPVLWNIFNVRDAAGNLQPLPPTVQCTFQLGAVYFTVYMGQACVSFVEDVFGIKNKTLKDMLLAAGVSCTLAPQLAVLFVACRNRALEMTDGQGGPPAWAQICMIVSTFSNNVQVLTCILLPLFTNAAMEVDDEGNASYDLRPMVGAYAVTAIKYATLLSLHGGVAAVMVSVWTMTPENCYYADKLEFGSERIGQMVGVTLAVTCLSLIMSSGKVVGLAVKFAIESVDEVFLGTQIKVGKAALSAFDGFVKVTDLVIANPPSKAGVQWQSDCLMKVDCLVVHVKLWRLIKTLGREFEIATVVLHGVAVNIEKSYGATSNAGEIVDHLESLGLPQPDASAPAPAAPAMQEPDVIVKHVSIRDIGATAILQGVPMTLQVADIEFEDFQKRLEGRAGSGKVVADAVCIVLQTLLRSILANGAFMNTQAMRAAAAGAVGRLAASGRKLCCSTRVKRPSHSANDPGSPSSVGGESPVAGEGGDASFPSAPGTPGTPPAGSGEAPAAEAVAAGGSAPAA